MRIRHITYLLASLPFFLTSCYNGIEISETPRTVLVYMVAQNNLSSYALSDFAEMEIAARDGALGHSRLFIYYDTRNQDPELRELTLDDEGNPQYITHLTYDDETLSVSSERLEQVIDDTKSLSQSHKYGIIFWGHGTGYLQDGIGEPSKANSIQPLSYGCESVNGHNNWMNVTTMAKVLDGKGFDWIYFDCCFMQGVEVAYELRNVTDWIIGSVTEIPANGMPYHKTLPYLMPEKANPESAALATFNEYDALSGNSRTCTMSVIRTAEMDNLARVMRDIYTSTAGLPDNYTPQAYQTDTDHVKYEWSYYDLGHYAEALAASTGYAPSLVQSMLDRVVTAAYATPRLWGTVDLANHSGLSTLIIESDTDPNIDKKGYRELSWWTDVVSHRFD